jgi:deoxyadenosine/deoxycytidine kinase
METRSILLLNGAYGVGKTTVAKRLRERLPRSRLLDPELIGYVLRRLQRAVPGSARRLDDYRTSPTWRAATILFAKAISRWARPLIVPMTLDRELLNALRDALTSRRCRVEHVCLVAPLATVYARLAQRGLSMTSDEGRWVRAKAAAACAEHASGLFERCIDTDHKAIDEVADDVIEQLEQNDR